MSIASSRRQRRMPLPALSPEQIPSSFATRPQPCNGANAASPSIEEAVDDQGMLCGGHIEHGLPLLKSWTRLLMGSDTYATSVRSTANDRYRTFVECLLRLARSDGSLAFSGTAMRRAAQHRDVWHAAAQLVEPRLQRTLNHVVRGLPADGRLRPSHNGTNKLPLPSANSEAVGLAVLRPTWNAPRLVVDYHGAQLRIELDRAGEILFSGACNPRLTIDGTELAPQSRWEQLCWITDDDVDYLELELTLTRELRIQRHLVFARDDQFLLIADAVLGKQPGVIEYQMALPLAADVTAQPARETRETALLHDGRRRAMVLPLALNEWRSAPCRGELRAAPGSLELKQSAAGASNLFAPLFIDLAPRRLNRPVTWRQLTVAEDRQIQPDDVAVGYRVHVGSRQWLFYRSLAPCGNRTLLGHNLVTEFLAARFSRQGVPDTLIEIEATPDEDD